MFDGAGGAQSGVRPLLAFHGTMKMDPEISTGIIMYETAVLINWVAFILVFCILYE